MDPLLEQLQRSLESAINGMSAEQFIWHPANKWCAAEILEHLYFELYRNHQRIREDMEAGKPAATRGSLGNSVPGRLWFWGSIIYPSGRQAPAHTRPKGLPRKPSGAVSRKRLPPWTR